jgi:hypothetical protein
VLWRALQQCVLFAPRLLPQVLQHVELLVELLGSPGGCRPQGFSTTIEYECDDPGKVFDYGQIPARQFPQDSRTGFAVADRIETIETQQINESVAPVSWTANQNVTRITRKRDNGC